MSTVTKTVAINAPVSMVWQEIVCRTDRMNEWMPHVIEARMVSDRPDALGAQASYRVEMLGVALAFTNEVTEIVDQQLLAYRSVSGDLQEKGYWRFEPVDADRCRLTFFMDYRLPGGLLGRLADRFVVHRAQEERIAEGLHNLKRRCELRSRLAA
jgi:uncharacterized membrane protein